MDRGSPCQRSLVIETNLWIPDLWVLIGPFGHTIALGTMVHSRLILNRKPAAFASDCIYRHGDWLAETTTCALWTPFTLAELNHHDSSCE